MEEMTFEYKTIDVNIIDQVCFIKINREESDNSINDILIQEFDEILDYCEKNIKIVVIEGNDQSFCTGADFKTLINNDMQINTYEKNPEQLYNIWKKLNQGGFVSISHVKGKANAGGIGFIVASDIVISSENAVFSLSEMLFDLIPACVMPFLIKKIGINKANYYTMMTKPFSAIEACNCGLVSICSDKSDFELKKCILRLSYLSKDVIKVYKDYLNKLNKFIDNSEEIAIKTNVEVFSNKNALDKIEQFITNNKLC